MCGNTLVLAIIRISMKQLGLPCSFYPVSGAAAHSLPREDCYCASGNAEIIQSIHQFSNFLCSAMSSKESIESKWNYINFKSHIEIIKFFLKSASLVHLSIVIIFHSNIAYTKHV